MSFKLNPLFNADSYKYNHINMYPKGITEVYSNFTPRSVKHLNIPPQYKTNEIVWFGGQAVIKDMVDLWNENFFSLSNKMPNSMSFSDLDKFIGDFYRIIVPFAGKDYKLSQFYALHKLGYLPLEIKTLDEGSIVPVGVPVLTVRNTLPEFYWLTNFIESYLSAELWKMSTSATIANYYRKIGNFWYEKTGANEDFLDFAFHDFSYRGMSGSMDAIKSGSGHLINFKGTDTVPAIPYLEYHYSGKDTFIGASVPATEHSIQTAFVENDLAYFNSILDVYPTGIVSIVADGYDYWGVLTEVLPQLKDKIMNRQPNDMGFAKTVIRPDSGDPVRIICGDEIEDYSHYEDLEYVKKNIARFVEEVIACETPHGEHGESFVKNIIQHKAKYYQYTVEIEWNRYDKQYYYTDGSTLIDFIEVELTAEQKGSVQVLWDLFGGTINDTGYKTLDSHIGLIYGDSITLQRAEEILERLEAKGFASDNVALGIGSYSYQLNSRDTLGFAMKATNITKDAIDIPLFKDPKTDDGTKKSAKGLLTVRRLDDINELVLMNNVSREYEQAGELSILFKDGKFLKHDTLEQIRNRLKGN